MVDSAEVSMLMGACSLCSSYQCLRNPHCQPMLHTSSSSEYGSSLNAYTMCCNPTQDVHATRNTSATITRVASSTTSTHIAVADSHHQVLLYAHLPYRNTMRWEYVGKSKSHHGAPGKGGGGG